MDQNICIPMARFHKQYYEYWDYIRASSILIGGTQRRSWLRHCVTSRKVAGSVPDGVIGIFY
jgi:hypothetical protein